MFDKKCFNEQSIQTNPTATLFQAKTTRIHSHDLNDFRNFLRILEKSRVPGAAFLFFLKFLKRFPEISHQTIKKIVQRVIKNPSK